MRIILLENVKNLGKRWEVKNVSDGYARNFLLPRKLADIFSEEAFGEIEKSKEKEKMLQNETRVKAGELADKIRGKEIIIKAKEKGGKLFGSINEKNIAGALKKEGIELEPEAIKLEESIKKIGTYEIKIKIGAGVETSVKIAVLGD